MTLNVRLLLFLIGTVLAGLGALAYVILRGDPAPVGAAARLLADEADRGADLVEPARRLGDTPRELRPETDSATALIPPTRTALEEAAAEGGVIVRVQLARLDDPEAFLSGFLVEAQSWIEATGETFLHETRSNENGVAQLVFPEFVHIDFVRSTPPAATGLAFAFVEDHVDLNPGDIYEEVLEFEPGAKVHGVVQDELGRGVAGAAVHAFADGFSGDVHSFDPGVIWAVSQPDGRYTLPPLPPGVWELAVKPEGWLQIEPRMDSTVEGRTELELEAGEDVNAGVLHVTALHRFRVKVVDGDGEPVRRAYVQLQPTQFDSPAIALLHPEQSSVLERFLAGPTAPDAVPWPYAHELAWSTNSAGEADALGIAGDWTLTVGLQLDSSSQARTTKSVPLRIPSSDRTVALGSSLISLHGRVVDLQDVPLHNVRLVLTRKQGRRSSRVTTSSRAGRDFSFEGLPPDGDYHLTASLKGCVPAQWPVQPGHDPEPQVFRLRRTGVLRIRLMDPDDQPLRNRKLRVSANTSLPGLRDAEARWLQQGTSTTVRTNKKGMAEFGNLPPGEHEVSLLLPYATGDVQPLGQPVTEERPFQTWALPIQNDAHVLVVDFSSYAPPQPAPRPQHTGIVLDATTGRPVEEARIRIQSGSISVDVGTGRDGSFTMQGFATRHSLQVLKRGYQPLEVPPAEYPSSVTEHRLELVPTTNEMVLVLVDKHGTQLPSCEVEFGDVDGAREWCLVEGPGGHERWRSQTEAPEGTVKLLYAPAGTLELEISINGYELATTRVEVPNGPAGTVRVFLEKSIEELRAELSAAYALDG